MTGLVALLEEFEIMQFTYNGDTWLHFTKKQQENLYIYFAQLMHRQENTDLYDYKSMYSPDDALIV